MHILAISYKPTNILSTFHWKSSNYLHRVSFRAATTRHRWPCSFQCNAEPVPIRRRSGNYKPSHWDFDYIQSLSSEYKEERHLKRASELVVQVRLILEETADQVDRLELIDDLQRLGISSHFDDEIEQILGSVYERKYCKNCEAEERDLYSTCLEFRLLRQHGFKVSQDIFDRLKNEKDDLKSSRGWNTKGLLQLYEASFLLAEGEYTLELAKESAATFLRKKLIDDDGGDDYLLLLARHALELPIHWRIRRPNARLFIDAYGRRADMNPIVLELAKLDFNVVQATYQEELKHVSRWWKSTGFAEKLPFARDRLVECYFWTIGVLEPRQYGYQRMMATKINALITTIDDIFDVYGTLEELQLFTDTIQRWDIESINRLPDYMQICYLALYNFVNEMAYDVLKEQGVIIIPYLKKSWADLIQTYLQEARWYYNGYKPSLEEYLNNAWISISAPAILSQIYFLVTNPIEKEAVESLYKYHHIVRWPSMILRLADDLATSPDEVKRGDVPKSIQCYMNEMRNASEEEAQEYVRFLIGETWKKMNGEMVSADSAIFAKDFMECGVNLARMAQFMYKEGDGHGTQHPAGIHDQIAGVLFEPYAYGRHH